MDTYPDEFIAHHCPLVFVAGLNELANDPSALPFHELVNDLNSALWPRSNDPSKRKFPVWLPSPKATDMHCILVDKTVRFPPLKARPAPPPASPSKSTQGEAVPAPTTAVTHSPISPLTPTSPLYPDGIIAPIWIRKHRELVPSVFVLVERLYEFEPSTQQGGPLANDALRSEREQASDAELVKAILERKRSTTERGTKLAVVILCSNNLISDPALDVRLSTLRRQAGLDARASLFVLSPVSTTEVGNFVRSLKTDLYPAAVDYYREHGRRVRRKRARPATAASRGNLSDKGWEARYDYKLALFAEMRNEPEVSLKHYEDSYETLLDMFGPAKILAPRTKRWAEAKVLCDSLTIKISKIYLYINERSKATAQLQRHIDVFNNMSEAWQIGQDTFEYWSWLTKQYRLFGDLLTFAQAGGLVIEPPADEATNVTAALPGSLEREIATNPTQHLQHPGFYYLFAARATNQRRLRYATAEQAFSQLQNGSDLPQQSANGEPPVPKVPPALAHERKVNHTAAEIELLSKAYENFKMRNRIKTTLAIASEMGDAHAAASDSASSLKFQQTVKQPYRDHRWDLISSRLAEKRLETALLLDDLTASIEAALEIHASSATEPGARVENAQVLQNLLQKWAASPQSEEELLISARDCGRLVSVECAFESVTANVGQPVKAQLSLKCPTKEPLPFSFSSLYVYLNEHEDRPLEIRHVDDETNLRRFVRLEPGSRTANLDLRFDGRDRVIEFELTAQNETDLRVVRVELVLELGQKAVTIEAVVNSDACLQRWTHETGKVVNRPGLSSSCRVRPRQISLDIDILHDKPAYIDEEYDITIQVENTDSVDADVTLEVLLQPGPDDAANRLIHGGEQFPTMIKEVSLGTIGPKISTRFSFRLLNVGKIYDRQLDLSIRAQNKSAPETTFTEIAKTVTVPVTAVLFSAFDVFLHPVRGQPRHLFDRRPVTGWENSAKATVVVKLCAAGPWPLKPKSIKLQVPDHARVLSSAISDADLVDLEWQSRDFFNAFFEIEMRDCPPDENAAKDVFAAIEWHRTGKPDSIGRTRLSIPAVKLKALEPSEVATVPASAVLHEPLTVKYVLTNPTRRVVTLSIQADSSPDQFVFSSVRKVPRTILAPFESREIEMRVVPLQVGPCSLPRLRVYEIDLEAEEQRSRITDDQEQRRPSGSFGVPDSSSSRPMSPAGAQGAGQRTPGPVVPGKEWPLFTTSIMTNARDPKQSTTSKLDPLQILVLPRRTS